MPDGDVETYYEDGLWKNRVEGDTRVFSAHENQRGAVAVGRQMAWQRAVEHIILNVDGRVAERNNYRHVPRTPQTDPPTKPASNGCSG